MLASVVAPEFIELVFLGIGISGMYHGIDIDHPVYAMLFCDVVVAAVVTVVNVVALGELLSLGRFLAFEPKKAGMDSIVAP